MSGDALKLFVDDVGVMGYREAWERQLALHERVLGGELAEGVVMLVEHPAVITIGRRAGAERHLLASRELLALRGVEVVETDRGGDITFHGPGQLVAYPIVPLNAYGLNLHGYMRLLEQVVIDALAEFGIEGMRDPLPAPATGVWARAGDERSIAGGQNGEAAGAAASLAKICALGIKVRRWVTLHGIALNVTTDLHGFALINPCGLSRPVTSMERLGAAADMAAVKRAFVRALEARLAAARAAPARSDTSAGISEESAATSPDMRRR
jgi:lipoate-protein ligase B